MLVVVGILENQLIEPVIAFNRLLVPPQFMPTLLCKPKDCDWIPYMQSFCDERAGASSRLSMAEKRSRGLVCPAPTPLVIGEQVLPRIVVIQALMLAGDWDTHVLPTIATQFCGTLGSGEPGAVSKALCEVLHVGAAADFATSRKRRRGDQLAESVNSLLTRTWSGDTVGSTIEALPGCDWAALEALPDDLQDIFFRLHGLPPDIAAKPEGWGTVVAGILDRFKRYRCLDSLDRASQQVYGKGRKELVGYLFTLKEAVGGGIQ
jgi:hypothetical protein